MIFDHDLLVKLVVLIWAACLLPWIDYLIMSEMEKRGKDDLETSIFD